MWNEDWLAERLGTVQHLVGEIPGHKLNLIVTPLKPPVTTWGGDAGRTESEGGQGKGMPHYYSLTRLKTEGVLHTSEGGFEVEGLSWMDHEFGSSQLTESQVGWDWFSVQLTNNYELMLYHMRAQRWQHRPAFQRHPDPS